MRFGTASRRHGRPAALALALAATLFLFATPPAGAAFFTVTTNAVSGPGSLRQAIPDANATQVSDVIKFNLPAGSLTIKPNTPLPVLTTPVDIDGTTQPGYQGKPLVEIDGSNVPSWGFQIAAV